MPMFHTWNMIQPYMSQACRRQTARRAASLTRGVLKFPVAVSNT